MPLVHFIAPTDPRWISTLDAIGDELVRDGLVYRYNPSATPDGLDGDEGTFSMCTVWYVECLARAGRLEAAQLIFEKTYTYANHLGLYSEQIGPSGELLGNFPQAFTHLALISAAIGLDRDLATAGGHQRIRIDTRRSPAPTCQDLDSSHSVSSTATAPPSNMELRELPSADARGR